jgi:hypothetical protein
VNCFDIYSKLKLETMSTVSTTSILGSDSISASRITINSNFLLLENWINQYVNVFGIDSVNGILDLSNSSTGRISAKTGKFDQIIVPVGGTALAQINSSGSGQFVNISTTTLTASGASLFSGTVTSNNVVTLNSTTNLFAANNNLNGAFTLLGLGHFVSQNSIGASGATAGQAFSDCTSGGGGRVTAVASEYVLTGLEDVIYANCAGGWFMSVGTTGASASSLVAGSRITIINTACTGGYIATGLQNSGAYYTGFNTDASYGNFPSLGITCDPGRPYQSAITLQWEPRISQGTGTQQGSWVVLSASNMSWS